MIVGPKQVRLLQRPIKAEEILRRPIAGIECAGGDHVLRLLDGDFVGALFCSDKHNNLRLRHCWLETRKRAALRADPKRAIGRCQRQNIVVRQVAVGRRVDLPLAVGEARQPAASRADPERAIGHYQRQNIVVRQVAVGRGVDLPLAVGEARQTAALVPTQSAPSATASA